MKLQVLILTQPSRQGFLSQLLPELNRQIKGHAAEIIVHAHDPKLTLGENRNRQMAESDAEYICFVDDDDWVAPDYFDRIMPLLDWDYVGFRMLCYAVHRNFEPLCEMFHSLDVGGIDDPWRHETTKYYRGLSHLNPIRRELAIQSTFDCGMGEDYRWAYRLWNKHIVQTQHYIDAVMYHYFWRAAKDDERDPTNPRRLEIIESISLSCERR